MTRRKTSITSLSGKGEIGVAEGKALKKKKEIKKKDDKGKDKTKTRKMRRKKDPNAPKKNCTPFMIFAIRNRQTIVNKHPQLKANIGEVAKLTGEMWKNLQQKDKDLYNKLAEEDKVRYQKEKAEYEKRKH